MLGIACMAPGVSLTTYGLAAEMTNGTVAGAYVITLIVILFSVYSYARMVRAYPRAGSAYTYTQKAVSPHLGFLVGWTIMLDYYFSPVFNAVILGEYLNAAFPSISTTVWIVLFVLVTTVINILGVKLSLRVNTILVLFQFLVVILFAALSLRGVVYGQGTGHFLTLTPFFNHHTTFSAVMSAIPLLYVSYMGFDLVTTFSEETREPRKTLPRAVFIVAMFGAVLGIGLTYIMYLIHPDFTTFKDPNSAAYEVAVTIGGNLFGSMFLAATIVCACFASNVSFFGSASRILYAMGRDNILPKRIFGYLSPRFNTPVFDVLIIGGLSLLAVFIDINTAASFLSYGALVAYTFVNISVIFHYFIKERQRSWRGVIAYLVVPLVGACVTGYVFLQLQRNAFILGSIWVVVGFIYLLFLTKFFKQSPPELHFEDIEIIT
ncbi:MAG: APC family permease [Alicyclobacillus sp.]|nr:APC family permease [Alicyclobacillus sp.]